jgi:hypothetical protein
LGWVGLGEMMDGWMDDNGVMVCMGNEIDDDE